MTYSEEIKKMYNEAIENIAEYTSKKGEIGSGDKVVEIAPMFTSITVTDADRIDYIKRQLLRVSDAISSVTDINAESPAYDNTADADCAGI